MKAHLSRLCAGILAVSAGQSMAADLTIDIQNLTQGMFFTPIAAVAHDAESSFFELGETASEQMQAMAEGASLVGIEEISDAIGADFAAFEGLTTPGTTSSISLTNMESNSVLSIVAMILPTNDGFIGLDNWTIPSESGTYTVYLNAYDAGTEANDEIRGGGAPGTPGMPVPPPLEDIVGTGGSGVTASEENPTVHIHRGNIGDDDLTGGISDVTNHMHRWLNPIAKVTITVN